MPFTLTEQRRFPSSAPHILITLSDETSDADRERAGRLARALRARVARAPAGYVLTPAAAERWRLLFEAGYDARTFYSSVHGLAWRFFLGSGKPRAMSAVLKSIRDEAALSLPA